ncbi:hypothetical protein D3C78_1660410 [compost metagenome]
MRPKDAAKAPELVNPVKVFVLDEPDMEVFLSLPQWLQDKIKGNLEFNGSPLQKALQGHKGSDKPKGKPAPQVEEEDIPEDAPEVLEDEEEKSEQDDIPW